VHVPLTHGLLAHSLMAKVVLLPTNVLQMSALLQLQYNSFV
jgi:hypothetical protein